MTAEIERPEGNEEVGVTPASELTFEQKQARYAKRIKQRSNRGETQRDENMPEKGAELVWLDDGELYEVIGSKHQGGNRGWSVKVKLADGTGPERHVRPYALVTVDRYEELMGGDE